MNGNRVRLPQLLWHDDDELEIEFPSSWDVTVCRMNGSDRPGITDEKIREAFANPIGTAPIRELARGKKNVAILFDDMTRPTRVAEIVPYVLEELKAAGVEDGGIRFIAAVGAHGAHDRLDFIRKLGEPVVGRYPIYNHNPYENCVYIGETSRGTPVSINSDFMSCDFKIGIGSILPHHLMGFSGGGKIIMPGIASIDTIAHNHGAFIANAFTRGEDPGIGAGRLEDNLLRLDLAEAAKMAGLDVKIDAVINARARTTDLFIGDPAEAHLQGARLAREVYATKPVENPDIAVMNTYCRASEAVLVLPFLPHFFKDSAGDLVIICNVPEGQVPHYLVRSFGKACGGRVWFAPTVMPRNVENFHFLSPCQDITAADWLAPADSITWTRTWPEVLERLTARHGDKARVAVVPDATMQYFV